MKGWDRRSFLKAATAATATGVLAANDATASISKVKPWNDRAARALKKFRDPKPTICRMCSAHCGVIATRDGDRVVQVKGNPGSPTNRGGICSRAYAGLERLYDGERILSPLARKKGTPRGSGEWEPIGWGEAFARIGRIFSTYNAKKMIHLGQDELLAQELRPALGWYQVMVDDPLPGRPGPTSQQQWYGAPLLDPDVLRSRTIYLFGLNGLDGRFKVPLVKNLMEAKDKGGSIHLFDAVEGATGSLFDWHPVTPGAESAVGFAIARRILERGDYDPDALARSLGDDPEKLMEALNRYTPEAVEELSGFPAANVVHLARRFAENKPSLALSPPHAPVAVAASLLNHLSGAINSAGGVSTARGPFFVEPLSPNSTAEAWFSDVVEGREKTDVYWAVDANPAYDCPDSERVIKALKNEDKIGLSVVMDTHMTETAMLADIFLPLATHFETWSLVEGCLPDGRSYLFLQQPVTQGKSESGKLKNPDTDLLYLFEEYCRPIGEARGFSDALLALARSLDPEITPYTDTRQYLQDLLQKSWGPGSFAGLAERGIWVAEEGRKPNDVKRASLVDVIPRRIISNGEALMLLKKAPETLPRRFANNRLGREIFHDPNGYIHPDTAGMLEFKDGQRVEVRTASGRAKIKLKFSRSMHPSAVVIPDGYGHTGTGRVARNENGDPDLPKVERTLSRADFLKNPLASAAQKNVPGEPIWWDEHGPGVSVRSLFPFRIEAGKVQNWGPLPLTSIRKT